VTGPDRTRVAVGEPREILALVCYSLGYRPQDSLALVGVREDRSTLVARIDLPAPADLIDALTGVCSPLLREHVTGVVAVLFTPTDPPVTAQDAAGVLGAATVLGQAGLRVHDLIWVGPTRYRSQSCPDPACCPPAGRQVAEALTDSLVAATEVAAGTTCAATEADLLAETRPRDVLPVETILGTDPGDAHAWLAAWTTWLAHPDRVDWARAIAGINRIRYRDAVMTAALAGELDPVAAYDAAPELTDHLLSRCPDVENTSTNLALLAALAARAPQRWRAQPLAAAAFLAWQSGRGVKARLLARAATDDDPTCSLAALVTRLIQAAVPPPWTTTSPGPT